jgi:hypothetical protein
MSDRKLIVTVMLGGPSSEREVSLRSGAAVAKALAFARPHRPRTGSQEPSWKLPPGTEIVFLALHGTYGEDGTVQEELEKLGVPYTGCGPEASRVAFDKVLTKKRCLARQAFPRRASWCSIRRKLPGRRLAAARGAQAGPPRLQRRFANGRTCRPMGSFAGGGLSFRHASVDGRENYRPRSHGGNPGRQGAAGGRNPCQAGHVRLQKQIHSRRRRAFLPGGF